MTWELFGCYWSHVPWIDLPLNETRACSLPLAVTDRAIYSHHYRSRFEKESSPLSPYYRLTRYLSLCLLLCYSSPLHILRLPTKFRSCQINDFEFKLPFTVSLALVNERAAGYSRSSVGCSETSENRNVGRFQLIDLNCRQMQNASLDACIRFKLV